METQGFVHRSSDPPLWSSYLSVEELTKEPGFFQPYPHQTIPRIKLSFLLLLLDSFPSGGESHLHKLSQWLTTSLGALGRRLAV